MSAYTGKIPLGMTLKGVIDSLDSPALTLAWSQDGAFLLCATKDKLFFYTADGMLHRQQAVSSGNIDDVIPLSGGRFAVTTLRQHNDRHNWQVTVYSTENAAAQQQWETNADYAAVFPLASGKAMVCTLTPHTSGTQIELRELGAALPLKAILEPTQVRRVQLISPDAKTLIYVVPPEDSAPNGDERTEWSRVKLHDLATDNVTVSPVIRTQIRSLALSPNGQTLAAAGKDGRIWIIQTRTGKLNTSLESHTSGVTSLAFSADGKVLCSLGEDDQLRLWHGESWQPLLALPQGAGSDSRYILRHQIALSPTEPLIALTIHDQQQRNRCVIIVHADYAQLLASAPRHAVRYMTAKVILLGDGGAGKTSLGYRLSEDTYIEEGATHGQHFWVPQRLSHTSSDGTRCEVVLWDFAGQRMYRLLHSLFLDDVDLALIVFDESRDQELKTAHYWRRQLRYMKTQPRMILVAAKTDDAKRKISVAEAEQFCLKHKITGGYVATSAKTNEGIQTLLSVIQRELAWDTRDVKVTTAAFRAVRDYILHLKTLPKTPIFAKPDDLRQRIQADLADNMLSREEFDTALKHLQVHGYIKLIAKTSDETLVLLQPERLINLAASILLRVNEDADGSGTLSESRLLKREYHFPELAQVSPDEADTLIKAALDIFIQRAVCVRQTLNRQTLLLFPSLIINQPPKLDNEPSGDMQEEAIYRIRGNTEHIFAMLVVLLSYTPAFKRTSLWHWHAEFENAAGETFSFRRINLDEDDTTLELTLSAKKTASITGQNSFSLLFEQTLSNQNVKVERVQTVICENPKCRHTISKSTIDDLHRNRLSEAFCPVCGTKFKVPTPIELGSISDREVQLEAKRERILSELRRTYEICLTTIKEIIRDRPTPPTCFISYSWDVREHERWVETFAADLENAGIDVWLDRWDNINAGLSLPKFMVRIPKADFVIVVGTEEYLRKYEDQDPTVPRTGVAAEMHLIDTLFTTGSLERQASILPILLSGTETTSLPPFARGRVREHFLQKHRYYRSLFGLLLSIHHIDVRDQRVEGHVKRLDDETFAAGKAWSDMPDMPNR